MHEMKPEHDCAAVGNINVLTVLLSTTIITTIYQILHLFVCLFVFSFKTFCMFG